MTAGRDVDAHGDARPGTGHDVSGHLRRPVTHVTAPITMSAQRSGPPVPSHSSDEPASPAAPSSPDGRTRLIDTAEQLLDERGLDAVSLRAVASAAGHRNPSAVHYHFGDREQLLLAVFERRHGPIEARRTTLIDDLDRRGDATPRELVAAALLPLADELRTVGGRRYLRLLLQGSVHPGFYQRTAMSSSPSLLRTALQLLPQVAHLPEEQRVHRLRMAIGLALYALADQARLIDTEHPPRPVLDHDTFCSTLLDTVLGAIVA
jgi:AcrR family transcriptional regulator